MGIGIGLIVHTRVRRLYRLKFIFKIQCSYISDPPYCTLDPFEIPRLTPVDVWRPQFSIKSMVPAAVVII